MELNLDMFWKLIHWSIIGERFFPFCILIHGVLELMVRVFSKPAAYGTIASEGDTSEVDTSEGVFLRGTFLRGYF